MKTKLLFNRLCYSVLFISLLFLLVNSVSASTSLEKARSNRSGPTQREPVDRSGVETVYKSANIYPGVRASLSAMMENELIKMEVETLKFNLEKLFIQLMQQL